MGGVTLLSCAAAVHATPVAAWVCCVCHPRFTTAAPTVFLGPPLLHPSPALLLVQELLAQLNQAGTLLPPAVASRATVASPFATPAAAAPVAPSGGSGISLGLHHASAGSPARTNSGGMQHTVGRHSSGGLPSFRAPTELYSDGSGTTRGGSGTSTTGVSQAHLLEVLPEGSLPLPPDDPEVAAGWSVAGRESGRGLLKLPSVSERQEEEGEGDQRRMAPPPPGDTRPPGPPDQQQLQQPQANPGAVQPMPPQQQPQPQRPLPPAAAQPEWQPPTLPPAAPRFYAASSSSSTSAPSPATVTLSLREDPSALHLSFSMNQRVTCLAAVGCPPGGAAPPSLWVGLKQRMELYMLGGHGGKQEWVLPRTVRRRGRE